MKIFLNEKKLDIDTQSINNLHKLILKIKKFIPKGYDIKSVKINNKSLDGEIKPKSIYLIENDIINFEMEIINTLIKRDLEILEINLKNITNDFIKCANDFRNFEENTANKNYVKLIDGFQKFLRNLENLFKEINKNIITFKNENFNFEIEINEIIALSDKMYDAHKQNDLIYLADLIEFEFVKKLESILENYLIFYNACKLEE